MSWLSLPTYRLQSAIIAKHYLSKVHFRVFTSTYPVSRENAKSRRQLERGSGWDAWTSQWPNRATSIICSFVHQSHENRQGHSGCRGVSPGCSFDQARTIDSLLTFGRLAKSAPPIYNPTFSNTPSPHYLLDKSQPDLAPITAKTWRHLPLQPAATTSSTPPSSTQTLAGITTRAPVSPSSRLSSVRKRPISTARVESLNLRHQWKTRCGISIQPSSFTTDCRSRRTRTRQKCGSSMP